MCEMIKYEWLICDLQVLYKFKKKQFVFPFFCVMVFLKIQIFMLNFVFTTGFVEKTPHTHLINHNLTKKRL